MKYWNVDLRSVVEALYRKDGVWDSLPQEEREKLENREEVFQRRTCYGDPIDEKVFCIRNESEPRSNESKMSDGDSSRT